MMAAYNGEDFIREQIESILNQQNVNLSLLITDDGSKDDTVKICESISQTEKRVTVQRNTVNKGAACTFMDMVVEAPTTFDYYAFSDQDDFWMPNKLERATHLLRNSVDEPALYYSDIENTDAQLHGGRREYAAFAKVPNKLKTLLVYNWASGCTMVFNAQLLQLLQKVPIYSAPRIHDVWVHLVARTCGFVVEDMNNSGIKRRITGKNQVGERNLGRFELKRVESLLRHVYNSSDHDFTRTATYLLQNYSEHMHIEALQTVKNFVGMRNRLGLRLRLGADSEYQVPSCKETLLIHVKMMFNRY
jgi:rhamnosyltransferase